MTPALALVTALSLPPGATATFEGVVTTSFDGARLGVRELFDLEGGGLRVLEVEGARVRLASTGAAGAVCAAVGVASPCLVPRLAEQAHARLLSVEEFQAGLRGDLTLSIQPPPPPPPPPPWPLLALFGLAATLLSAFAWFAWTNSRRASPLGAVLLAAQLARRAAGNDATLAVVRSEIERMVDHAREVDRVRAGCLAALAKVDALPGARLAAEHEEERRLRDDLARAVGRLHELAAALRLISLRVREARDLRFSGPAPVEAILAELSLRDRAMSEASRL